MTACAGPGTGGATHESTIAAYERAAAAWADARSPTSLRRAEELSRRARTGAGPSLDLGCGPGWHLPPLPRPAVALDASRSMLDLVPHHDPEARRVQADLTRLPFAPGAALAAFASKAYVHLDARDVPRALADLHRTLAAHAPVALSFFGSGRGGTDPTVDAGTFADDDFPGRRYSRWQRDHLEAVVEGAGIDQTAIEPSAGGDGVPHLWVEGRRRRTLPDTVGPGMRLLVCGLNPSLPAADAGIGFVTPGNRFWPAARRAGLVSRDRDPFHALDGHGIGMTDLVKRATRRADELAPDEYRRGLARVERLVRWLSPGAVCFVGLAGYRAAVDRRAVPGRQDRDMGGRPVYLMPSTSGLNTHSRLEDLTEHLRRVGAVGD